MNNLKHRPFHFREVIPKIENNLQYMQRVKKEDYDNGYNNVYWTFDFISFISDYINFDEIKTIFDIGSRDALQSLELLKFFPKSKIYAFEAAPNSIKLCYKNAEGSGIEIAPYACADYDGEITFNVMNGNAGASSLLKTTNNATATEWGRQHEIIAQATRLDTFMRYNDIKNVDMLWMDVQGAEKLVLDGLGDKLKNVKVINTEVGLTELYHGSILAEELDEYMKKQGFTNLITYYLDVERSEEDLKKLEEVEIIYINNKFLM